MNTATVSTGSLARLLASLGFALVLALTLAREVGAAPAKGVSIGDRTQSQRDLCSASDGKFTVETTTSSVFRGVVTKTVTTCEGGKNPQTCTNTKNSTTCTQGFIPPSQDPVDDGSIADGQIDEVQTAPEPEVIVDDGAVSEGQIEPISPGDPDAGPVKPHRIEIYVEFAPIEPLP